MLDVYCERELGCAKDWLNLIIYICVCVYNRNLDESSDVSKQLTVKHVHILKPIANLQLWGWSGSQRPHGFLIGQRHIETSKMRNEIWSCILH